MRGRGLTRLDGDYAPYFGRGSVILGDNYSGCFFFFLGGRLCDVCLCWVVSVDVPGNLVQPCTCTIYHFVTNLVHINIG